MKSENECLYDDARRVSASKVVAGMKECKGCLQMRKKEMFQQGSAYDYECRRAKKNLDYAAKAQGQVTWWTEQREDPAKMKYILAQYLQRCPKIKKGCQRPPFKILVYMEEERRERALLLDSDKEMMDEYEFTSWMAKPENGSMKAGEAMRLYEVYHAMPGAITDLLGKHKECPRRVAIDTKTLIINRDARISAKSATTPVASPPYALECRRAKQNLYNAAKAQGQVTWWKEQCKDPSKMKYILAQYMLRCPKERKAVSYTHLTLPTKAV